MPRSDAGARIVLASASPRRREILALLGVPFEVVPAEDVDEEAFGGPAERAARELALAKAASVFGRLSERAPGPPLRVLAADTIVAVEVGGREEILGKPRDEEDARRMLALLSGREHVVWTGLALLERGAAPRVEIERSEVAFRALSAEEIAAYVASGEPSGKAGAYAIQGAGGALVAGFRGCYANIVGLPLVRAARLLGLPPPDCGCGEHPLQRSSPGCRER